MKTTFATLALFVASALPAIQAAAQPPQTPEANDPFRFFGVRKPAPPEDAPDAETRSSAAPLEEKLREPLEIQIGTVPMSEFIVELGKAIEAPVFFEPHSEWTELSEATSVTLETSGLPLEVELKKALRPHGLRAIVHDDALLIVPDTEELARRGIGTERYVSIDDSYMRDLEEKLAQPYAQSFNGIPLQDAVRILSTETDIKFVIDTRALEDLGLTRDLPITIDLSDVSVYGFLQLMLRDSDLTLMPREGYVMITTVEEAQDPSNQTSRVYWLDGTGLSPDAATEAIETAIEPDTWEALGGPSAMEPLMANEQGRKTLIVTSTYAVHREIEKLLGTIRQGVVDPRAAYIDRPSTKGYYGPGYAPHGSMGGMGMGGMGMGGMGMEGMSGGTEPGRTAPDAGKGDD